MRCVYCILACLGTALPGSSSLADATEKAAAPRVQMEVRLAEKEPAPGLEEMMVPSSKTKIYVHKKAVLSNADIAEARATKDQSERPAVEIIFAKGSRDKVARLTEGNIDKHLAIFVDGKLIAAPVIRGKISGGKAVISGRFAQKEAERIANGLKAR